MIQDNSDLIAYHCVILSEGLAKVMNTMVKLTDFHQLLRGFLTEMEADANDPLLHNNVRWLSKGNALGHFWSIRKEIAAFLQQLKSQKATQFANFLQDRHKMDMVADITGHLKKILSAPSR